MKLPGPDHPISIAPYGKLVVVSFHGQEIARSSRALALKEAQYPVALYLPSEDARLDLMTDSAHQTDCPYKGTATYRSLADTPGDGKNAVWSYEDPYPAMDPIKGHVAFYANQVEIVVSDLA
jgi:uncharacterized protein (DUF427 family)